MIPVKAILDASPIIAFFAEMREPHLLLLLKQLGYDLLVPDAVFRLDITKEPSKTILARCVEDRSMSLLPPIEPAKLEAFTNAHPSLGEGESEVILAAVELLSRSEEIVCIIDESPARRVASQLGLPLKGTIGVLHSLRASGLVTDDDLLRLKNKLRASGFRADASLLR